MVVIPAGSFQMGAKKSFFSSAKPSEDELPQHRVSIQPFAIGKFEITQEQWKAVMGNNPSRFIGSSLPVEQVSWDDAHEFIKKLSEITGQQYRLPTEAEWEFAARAGTETEFSFGDSAKDHEQFSFSKQNSGGKTNQVGMKKPNSFGLHDMHGNVVEWTQDCWKPSYSGAPTDGSANFPNRENCRKVLRGGSWQTNPEFLRSAQRIKFPPEARFDDLGLRVVRELR
jgi:formylglycine-generating enzyme required for sulfatase activity